MRAVWDSLSGGNLKNLEKNKKWAKLTMEMHLKPLKVTWK